MLEGQNASDGGESTQDEVTDESTNNSVDVRTELESFKNEILNQIGSLKQAPSPEPQITAEKINELWKTNPSAAIELALEKKLNEKIAPVKSELSMDRQKDFFDRKAEEDFPLLKSDKQFQKLVAEKAKVLMNRDGLSKNSPTLIHLAAELAAAQYKPKASTKGDGGFSAEAPSGGSRPKPGSNPESSIKNFNALKKMFIGEGKDADASAERFKKKLSEGKWGKQ